METAIIVLGIGIVLIGISILKRCNKILANVEWLEGRFLSQSPATGLTWKLDLAHEVFSMRERLAPLFFLPFAYEANQIRQLRDTTNEEFEKTLKKWERIEREEMEYSAAQGDEFAPSGNLEEALRAWCLERHKTNVVDKWEDLFKDVYIDLITGKVNLHDAGERLEAVSSLKLAFITESDPEVENIFKDWSANWAPEKWKERLRHLQEREDGDQDFKREMRKQEILSKTS